jgi:hypothetical protein
MHYAERIPRHHVNSTAVRSVGYDAENWVLQIEFAGGKVYNYYRVPPDEHAKLVKAASIGTYVNREVKPYYEYEEDEGEDE